MKKEELDNLINIFKKHKKVVLVYFFGSKARNDSGPMSDHDLAIYFDEKDKNIINEERLMLIGEITRALKTDKVDLVVLNTAQSSELKYNIIKEGKIIYEKNHFRVELEPKILNEYFDYSYLMKKNHCS
jgi:predicted nucleotidyltransferase